MGPRPAQLSKAMPNFKPFSNICLPAGVRESKSFFSLDKSISFLDQLPIALSSSANSSIQGYFGA